jgi:hypothetical protein
MSLKDKETKAELKFTIGCDPEVFLRDNEGHIAPAFLFIKGTKDKPEPITDKGHAIQYDNCSAEYNVPPSDNVEEFIEHNKFVLQYLKDAICAPNNLTLDISPSVLIKEEYTQNPISLVFGCEPDYNAWNGEENSVIKENPLQRVAGGHIHIGIKGLEYHTALEIIRAMDIFLSVPLVLLEPLSERKKMYGKAGAFRFKTIKDGGIGIVEYRTPSNFWLTSEEMMKFAYNAVKRAVAFVNEEWIITNPEEIQECINTNNGILAQSIIDDYQIEIPSELKATISHLDHIIENHNGEVS